MAYHNLKLSKKEFFLSKKGSRSRKSLHTAVNCHIQNCGKVNDVLFPHPLHMYPFILYLYMYTYTKSCAMCIYRDRDVEIWGQD